ncbi:MAG: Rrf2 family transcriptional regulator [Lactobacillaceae bacterium]|nr:Rrf2 family transcriptional regulator [Lactobacillaceae bacterium]
MRYSYKFSDAIHLLTYLVIYRDGDRSSKAIANSIEANPSAVRKMMADFRQADLLVTQSGRAQPTLAKSPATITLLDIYLALKMDHNLLHVDPATNPNDLVGREIQPALTDYYQQIQTAAFQKMATITLANVVDRIRQANQKVSR